MRLKLTNGARDRNRTGTPVIHEAADFKSDVSTYFTTRARRRRVVGNWNNSGITSRSIADGDRRVGILASRRRFYISAYLGFAP